MAKSVVLGWLVFLYVVCFICYHHIEMVSFIKLFPVIRSFLLQLMLMKCHVLLVDINSNKFSNVFERFCVDAWWGVVPGLGRVDYLFTAFFFLAYCQI